MNLDLYQLKRHLHAKSFWLFLFVHLDTLSRYTSSGINHIQTYLHTNSVIFKNPQTNVKVDCEDHLAIQERNRNLHLATVEWKKIFFLSKEMLLRTNWFLIVWCLGIIICHHHYYYCHNHEDCEIFSTIDFVSASERESKVIRPSLNFKLMNCNRRGDDFVNDTFSIVTKSNYLSIDFLL